MRYYTFLSVVLIVLCTAKLMSMEPPKHFYCHYTDTPHTYFDVTAVNKGDAEMQLKDLAPDLSYQINCEQAK